MISVPFLSVRDLTASLAFYVDVLEFSIARRWDDRGRLRWCWLEQDAIHRSSPEFIASVGCPSPRAQRPARSGHSTRQGPAMSEPAARRRRDAGESNGAPGRTRT